MQEQSLGDQLLTFSILQITRRNVLKFQALELTKVFQNLTQHNIEDWHLKTSVNSDMNKMQVY